MKEIKAYVRSEKIEEVILGLKEIGVCGFTVIDVVNAIGTSTVPEDRKFSIEYAEEYSPMKKLEIVCRDRDVDKYIAMIRKKAYTGHRGDGMIFISPIESCMKIRTGECGEGALVVEGKESP